MCNREAPGLEQFARDHASQVTVVGIGTQDTLELANKFVARNGVKTIRMYWDRSGKTWQFYGVRGQPAALLIRNGKVVASWTGVVDEAAVLKALA